jgi:hypothetical protein
MIDGRSLLRVTMARPRERFLVAECSTVEAALEVLRRHGVPLDQLVREELPNSAAVSTASTSPACARARCW